ncbi:MAG: S8 family serine peptidase [Phycisphaerales bacterium]|nr:MAG: S8 family serine peptidase [Phycisphaerales bacterium]
MSVSNDGAVHAGTLGFSLLGMILSVNVVSAQSIAWRSGAVDATQQSSLKVAEIIQAVAEKPNLTHLVVQFSEPVGPTDRAGLAAAGIDLLAYLGSNAFFASISADRLDMEALSDSQLLVDARPIERLWKLHPLLVAEELPTWALRPAERASHEGKRLVVGAYVVFHQDVSLDTTAVQIAEAHEAAIRARVKSVHALVVDIPFVNIDALAREDVVQWIEPPLPRMSEVNDSVRAMTETDLVQVAPYGLDGSGVTALVYDGGFARESHLDFSGRLSVRDSSGLADHATHVACTVGGSGAASGGTYRGMAPGVAIESYGYEYDGTGIFLYSNPGDLESDYDEAINEYWADIANNSIGTNTCWNGFPCSITGDYGVTSALIDAIVGGSLGRPLRVVWANGNERSCPYCPDEHYGGYHTTAPPACAKNHIAVGALNSNDDSQTGFSSWGPTDDGRLKPDVSAPGCQGDVDYGVTSCSAFSDTSYLSACGTSMAAPTVTGISALLLQDYRALYPTRPDFLNSTLKAILAHTAQDLDPPGPDYKSGYGSVRIRQAVDFIRSNHGLNVLETSTDQGETFTIMARVAPQDTQLKVTLAWDDVPGTVNVAPNLVNDLDLRLHDPDGGVHLPWGLNPTNPAAAAVPNQIDHINNTEQVLVHAPATGLWMIEISAFNIPVGPQTFSLCCSPRLVYDCDANGQPDDQEIAADPSLDCSDNGTLDICEPDCDSDGLADSCEIFSGTSNDCNANGAPDDCEPDVDCNANGVQDICDLAAGTSHDCNRNDLPDECDVSTGTSADCNTNIVPDECETQGDCNENGVQDICDIADGTSDDCNGTSVPDECEIYYCGDPTGVCTPQSGDCCDSAGNDTPGCDCATCCQAMCNMYDPYCCYVAWDWICAAIAASLPECDCGSGAYSPDCNDNGIPDECDVADGTSLDCNANTVPDECDPGLDCNDNGIQDICDVAAGTSQDCDADEVPDECQPDDDCNANTIQDICDLAAGTSLDCNGNAIPDECDLADGTSYDCNTNGTPDECEPLADCNANGVPDICDLALGTSDDCNANAVPDECDIFDCGPPVGSCPGTGDCCSPEGNGTRGCDCSSCCAAVCELDYWCCFYEWDDICAWIAWNVSQCDCDGPDQDWSDDCNGNGVPDECDIAGSTSTDCDFNGIPDDCAPDLDCNGNGVQDICDVADGSSEDCNANRIPDECETDCNSNSVPDDCDIAAGTSHDCEGNGIPDECDPLLDCNDNGAHDPCDVLYGTSDDCNTNVIPDECEVDCNDNNLPDECELYDPPEIEVDHCADAGPICSGRVYVGAIISSTQDGASTCDWWSPGNDVWYRYVPESDGDLTVSLCGSLYDTVVSIHSSCPGNADSELACNDDACQLQSELTMGVQKNTPYWIRISGDYSYESYFRLELTGPQSICDPTAMDCNGNERPDECDVADGTSPDCNANGTPDQCDPDCNNNGNPDDCDVADGLASDCNGNNHPDECDITESQSQDCNDNQIPDECDLADDYSPDCNYNDRPDECDLQGLEISSPELSPIGAGADRDYTILGAQPALSPVSLEFSASADLQSQSERIDVYLNDVSIAHLFGMNGHDCPSVPDVAQVTVDAATFNGALNGGEATLRIRATGDVDPDACDPPSFIQVSVQYAITADCNENAVPDECETDCNQNGIPDDCDVADETSFDCNGNWMPDECESECNGNGVPDDCDVASGASPDCNTNGVPDECDTDTDGDGTIDDCDPCPFDDPDDTDGDRVCDSDDMCPHDPGKFEPGACGCGVPDDDDDADGTANCNDQCPGVDDDLFAPDCLNTIPTASGWALILMTLTILAWSKALFNRRRSAKC